MRLSTFIYERVLNTSGLSRQLWNLSRRVLVKLFNDPPISMSIHGTILQMPLSHALPIYLKDYPFYDRLPGRLTEYLYDKDGFLKCIDVGANIGDSIAGLYRHSKDTFLAIEPNPKFNRYLRKNWGDEKNVTILDFLCFSSSKHGTYMVKEMYGTASFYDSAHGIQIQSKSLDDIVAEIPTFSDPNLIKVDTDGHDFEVIAGAKSVIATNLPAVIFELDVFANVTYLEDCMNTLSFFNNMGYRNFLLYDNFGNFMGTHQMDSLSHLKDLLFYQLMRKYYYFDILIMKEEDIENFLTLEHAHFVDMMLNKTF